MSSVAQPPSPAPPADVPPEEHSNHWKWIAIGLAVLAVGLLVWAIVAQSDANDKQAQIDEGQQTGAAVVSGARQVYDELSSQLGATNEDLAQTQNQVAKAEKDAAAAQDQATAAQKQADQAQDAQAKAQAEADAAKADAKAAESRLAVAGDCAKAYVGAFGALLGGTGADQVKQDLDQITNECQAALGGS